MADYPAAITDPRVMVNRPGVVYDVLKTKVIFAEDFNKDRAEIVAIQEALGVNLENVLDWKAFGAVLEYSEEDPPIYVANTDIDLRGVIQPGTRIKLTNGGSTKFFIVVAIDEYALWLYGGTDYILADSAITLPYFSASKAPFGFPLDPQKWAQKLESADSAQQATPTQNQWYNLNNNSLSIPIGVWNVSYYCSCFLSFPATIGYYRINITLSNANNTLLDSKYSCRFGGRNNSTESAGRYEGFAEKSFVLALTSKASYYLNFMTSDANVADLYLRGSDAKTIISAVCAYL